MTIREQLEAIWKDHRISDAHHKAGWMIVHIHRAGTIEVENLVVVAPRKKRKEK